MVHGVVDKGGQLVVVEAAHGDRVELEGDARVEKGVHVFPDLAEQIAARDLFELVPVERVEGQVHRVQAYGFQCLDMGADQRPVGGHADVEGGVRGPQAFEEIGESFAREGLAARQPDFFHAHVHRHVHKLFHLLIAQDGFVGNERLHAAAAVGAAQVAAVGNREADVADGPAVAVFQRSGGFAQMGEGWDCVHGTARWLCAARGGAVGRSLHRIPSSLAWQAVLCLCSRAASAMRLACSSSPGKLMLKKGRASARV